MKRNIAQHISEAGLLNLVSRCSNLQWLDLGCVDVSVDTLVVVLHQVATLQYLCHDDVMQALHVYSLQQDCTPLNLTKLEVKPRPGGTVLPLHTLVPKLSSVQLIGTDYINECMQLECIKELDISSCYEQQVACLISKFAVSLKTIKLVPNLQSMSTFYVFNIIRSCPNLKILILGRVRASREDEIVSLPPDLYLSDLEELNYLGCTVPDDVESLLLQSMILSPSLHTLRIKAVHLNSALVSACKVARQRPNLFCNLKYVHFCCCTIETITLITFICLAPNLKLLEIINCNKVDVYSMDHFCPRSKFIHMDFSGCNVKVQFTEDL